VDAIAATLQDPAALGCVDAEAIATQLLGDSIFTNPVMLGFAWQKGWIPLGQAAILRAMDLNAVAVDKNQAAFQWGRLAAHDPAALARALAPAQAVQFIRAPRPAAGDLEALIDSRAEFLTRYQNAAYAARYRALVQRVQQAEAAAEPANKQALSLAVARYLFKLMAYKDEYEVARLHSDAAFRQQIAAMFEGDYQLNYHLAPPLLAQTNAKGELQKQRFGAWMGWGFKLLAPLKFLRGSAFDPFGRSAERHHERAVLTHYVATLELALPRLNATSLPDAMAFASLPEQIRGFGHVKARHWAALQPRWNALARALGASALA
jgi:indolepyruvate ferredoxin oxidoreductase